MRGNRKHQVKIAAQVLHKLRHAAAHNAEAPPLSGESDGASCSGVPRPA